MLLFSASAAVITKTILIAT